MKWIVLISLICYQSFAASYYVDFVAGSDSNNGTSSGTPFQHCPGDQSASSNAKRTLAAGDTVIFKGGVSYGFYSTNWISANASGTAGNVITYLSGDRASPQWGSGPAVIDDTSASTSALSYGSMDFTTYSYLVVNGLSFVNGGESGNPYWAAIGGAWNTGGNILIENCSVSNSLSGGVYIRGAPSSSLPSTFIVSNCVMQNLGQHGVFLRYGMTNAQVLNNIIHDIGTVLGADPIAIFGLDQTGVNVGMVVRSNELYNIPIKSDIIFQNYTSNALVEDNWFHGSNGFSGFDLDGCLTNTTIRNNLFDIQILNFYGPITANDDQGNRTIDGLKIYNNTFRASTTHNGMIFLGRGNQTQATAFYNVDIRNNIVIDLTDNMAMVFVDSNSGSTGPIVDLATFSCDYNTYAWGTSSSPFVWNGVGQTFANWKTTTGQDSHSVNGTPTWDGTYHLLSSDTVALDKGVNLIGMGFSSDKYGVARPQGSAWDIGAYELVYSKQNNANQLNVGRIIKSP